MSWNELATVELVPGVFIPSLEQVLKLVGARGTVYVELKGRGVEERAVAVIRESQTPCAVHSFDHSAVVRVSRFAPSLRRGILFEKYPNNVEQAMRESSALDVWPQWELIDAALVGRVHAAGGRVIAWTVNTAVAVDRLVKLNVDGLCGDDVRLLPS
jgi:glycerophosphoryl diester phosphodiesterase